MQQAGLQCGMMGIPSGPAVGQRIGPRTVTLRRHERATMKGMAVPGHCLHPLASRASSSTFLKCEKLMTDALGLSGSTSSRYCKQDMAINRILL